MIENKIDQYIGEAKSFAKFSDSKLKDWVKKNSTDDQVSPVFGMQIKAAMKELKKRGLKMNEIRNQNGVWVDDEGLNQLGKEINIFTKKITPLVKKYKLDGPVHINLLKGRMVTFDSSNVTGGQ
jgi:hypothetical protein